MALQMNLTDEIRINILDALLKKGAVVPNVRQIKRHTGYHKATIKSSLDFFEKEGLLEGYGPKVNFKKLGYDLETIVLLEADLSNEKVFDKFLAAAKKDPHLYRFSAIMGAGNWNLVNWQIHKDVESYHHNVEKNYYKAIPGIYNLIRNRQIFYATEPYYKNASRTKSLIEIIKKEKGLD